MTVMAACRPFLEDRDSRLRTGGMATGKLPKPLVFTQPESKNIAALCHPGSSGPSAVVHDTIHTHRQPTSFWHGPGTRTKKKAPVLPHDEGSVKIREQSTAGASEYAVPYDPKPNGWALA